MMKACIKKKLPPFSPLAYLSWPWEDELGFEVLRIPTAVGDIVDVATLHRDSGALLVTDALVKVPREAPSYIDPEHLLLLSRQSTAAPPVIDSKTNRQIGWEKSALLASYFFPQVYFSLSLLIRLRSSYV